MIRRRYAMELAKENCAVNTYNEWDLLEEVVVGRIEDSGMVHS
jgi:hypothetical protein